METRMKKTLIVYYSWHNGNTKKIAEMIKEKTGADIERIDTTKPYPEEYRKASDQGKHEVETGFKPELKAFVYDPADYDVIIVGTPTWWYSMAPAVHTYLAEHDFNGKTVIPFMTMGGWPGKTIENMKKDSPGVKHILDKEILFDSKGGPVLQTPLQEIEQWIEEINRFITEE